MACLLFCGAFGLFPDAADAQSLEYQRALARVLADPSSPEASFQLAAIAAQDGDQSSAIAALERVLLLNPGLDNIRLELGVLYLAAGSPGLGAEMIRDAMASPDMPDEVRIRAGQYLDLAETSGQRLRISGQIGAGIASESNANSGPDSVFPIGGGTLDPEALGRGDTAFTLQAGVALRYDLGLQAGHSLAFDLGYAGQRYSREHEVDLDRLGAAAGVDLNLHEAFGRPAELALRIEAATYRRSGDHYLDEFGVSAFFRLATTQQTGLQLGAFFLEQDFIPTPRAEANSRRDGRYIGLNLRHDWSLSDTASVWLGVGAADKGARADYEAFGEFNFSTGYALAFEAPLWSGNGPWIASLSGNLARRDYDAVDPDMGLSQARRDTIWRIAAALNLPLAERSSLAMELSYFRQDSNTPVNEYDNFSGAIRVNHRF